ncbi:MAG TPA: DUF2851 family protein [Ktedonobacterales bacterium]|nr:DUF2851 family protein [Ktedonobacterales bacterium]
MPTTTRTREAELAARWSAGMWRGATLRSEGGETFRVIFEGRRGGGAGPDFRDAVLALPDGSYVFGDIELHLRPAGWHAHGHASDPRYNGLALHVVLRRGACDPADTPLASGRAVPLVVLGETQPLVAETLWRWPCAEIAKPENAPLLAELLHTAGMARFAEHAARLEDVLRESSVPAEDRWDSPNRVLWLALAEALGYGRDRAALQRLGESLLAAVPASLDYTALPGIERLRARGLLAWYGRWQHSGPWAALEPVLRSGEPRQAVRALLAALRVEERGAVSPGRAAIVAVNVALPFAAALAEITGDSALASQARSVYQAWPGLPSNQIVREMARTLGLARLPRGALAQQGLHHLWQHACREKRCDRCPCALAACG